MLIACVLYTESMKRRLGPPLNREILSFNLMGLIKKFKGVKLNNVEDPLFLRKIDEVFFPKIVLVFFVFAVSRPVNKVCFRLALLRH